MIKQCPKCTYPLRTMWLNEWTKRIYCSNKQCEYEKVRTDKKKKEKYNGN